MSAPHRSADTDAVRVLVVDDSAIVRGLIISQLETHPGLLVVGRAANGEAAVQETRRLRPDVVVLDLEMPVMDGMAALPLILAANPGVRVIIASTLSQRNARISLEALTVGAQDYVPKPQTGSLVGAETFHRELAQKVLALGRSATQQPEQRTPVAAPATDRRLATPRVLAIGGSTGAPPALLSLFEGLRGLNLPILLTQHMPPNFTGLLAEQLGRAGQRPCAEGVDGEAIIPGRAYVAPGGWHMTVCGNGATPVIRLNQEPQEHFCRPAVDPLLRSAASVFGSGLMTIVLTGMGSDGAEGCRAVAGHGGRFIVQDEATSVVWGMPGAAARTGLAEAILPLDQIAAYVMRAVGVAK